MKWTPIALIIALLTLAACDLAGSEDPTPIATPSATAATAVSTEVRQEPSATDATVMPPAAQGITLTIWTNTTIAPNSEVAGGPILLEQLSEFDSDHSDVHLLVELKTIADQGGTLSYLRTGRSIAPSILPDVILLPSSELPSAATQGLIFPLDSAAHEEAIDDLYPVARDLVTIDDQIYGYPFALTNLQHLVYDTEAITETVPVNWNSLVTEPPGMLIYPAAGSVGAQLTAQLYRELGGTFVNDEGQPALQTEPLAEALTLVQQGITGELIDLQSGSAGSLDQTWQIFEESPSLWCRRRPISI